LYIFQQKSFILQMCHLVRKIFTFFEKHAKNLNAHSEKFGELGLTAGFKLSFKRLKYPKHTRSSHDAYCVIVGSWQCGNTGTNLHGNKN
jgi:hypothetical protein